MDSFVRKVLFVVFAFVLPFAAAAGGLYRWTDENGKVHMSDKPPPAGIQARQIAAPRAQSGSSPVADEQDDPSVSSPAAESYGIQGAAPALSPAEAQRKRLLDAARKAERERLAREREARNRKLEDDLKEKEAAAARQQAEKCRRLKELADSASGFQANYDRNCR